MTDELTSNAGELPPPSCIVTYMGEGRGLHYMIGTSAGVPLIEKPAGATLNLYTADQLRAAVAKERDRCAKVCDGKAQIMESAAALADADDRPAMLSTAWKIRLCTAAIRAGS